MPDAERFAPGLATASTALALLLDGWWPGWWADPCARVAECVAGEPLFDTGALRVTREGYAGLLPGELRQGVLDALPGACPRHGENLGSLVWACERWRREVSADVGMA